DLAACGARGLFEDAIAYLGERGSRKAESLLQHLEDARLPDDVERIDAVIEPPLMRSLRVAQCFLFADEAAVGVQHDPWRGCCRSVPGNRIDDHLDRPGRHGELAALGKLALRQV